MTIEESKQSLAAALAAKVEAKRDLEARTAELETCDPSDAPKLNTAVVKAAAALRAGEREVARCEIALAEVERAAKVTELEAARIAADPAPCRAMVAEIAGDLIALENKISELKASASRVIVHQNSAHAKCVALSRELGAPYDGHAVPDGQLTIVRSYLTALDDPTTLWEGFARSLAHAFGLGEFIPGAHNWTARDRVEVIVNEGLEAYRAHDAELTAKSQETMKARRDVYLARERAYAQSRAAHEKDPSNVELREQYRAAAEAFGVRP